MKVEKSLLSFLYLNEIILHIYYIHVTKSEKGLLY